MRYFVKINKAGYPVPNSLVYSDAIPKVGRWYEIIKPCLDCEGDCIQMNKPQGYYQKVKYYYTVDEWCHPIAGSNVSAYCKPSPGRFMEYFPTCLIKPCELEIKNYIITYKGPSSGGCVILYITVQGGTGRILVTNEPVIICAQINSIQTTCAIEDFEIIESWDNCIQPTTTTTTSSTTTTSTTSTSTSTTSSTTTSSTSSTTSSTTSTTSSTTTTTQDPVICYPIYNSFSNVYRYNFDTNTSTTLNVPGFAGSADIAHTTNKLWIDYYMSGSSAPYLAEWDISSIDPFVCTFNRYIRISNTTFWLSYGLSALSDTVVVAIDEQFDNIHVVELDVTTSPTVQTFKFALATTNRYVAGDFLVTVAPTPKFIVTTYEYGANGGSYISQYDYNTGKLELDLKISPTIMDPWAIFQDNNEIYIGDNNGNLYHIDKTHPYEITLIDNIGTAFSGGSQIPSCLTATFELPPNCLNVNGTFDTDLSGWTLQPNCLQSWSWSSDYGGSAQYSCSDEGSIISQNILTIGSFYRITFNYYIVNNDGGTVIKVLAGTTDSGYFSNLNGTHYIDIILMCTGNSTFSIFGNDSSGTGSLFINNVCVKEAVLTPDQTCVIGEGWSTKNLAVTKYANGDNIPYEPNSAAWGALTTGAYCCPNGDCSPGNIETYGYLYNWYAVNDPRGLAPNGYHIPTQTEIETLITCLGGNNIAGGKMKIPGTSYWFNPNTGATNSSGFNGVGAGYRYSSFGFFSTNVTGYFWTSTEFNVSDAINYAIEYNNTNCFTGNTNKANGLSVRVIAN